MYARLWWKDARQLWPIWAFLALAALAAQWLALRYWSTTIQQTSLVMLAIMWTSLYAIACGAAAFAGEREVGTLMLLDITPVPRRVVWSGKLSFALVTTLVLVSLLLAMAALGTPPEMSSISAQPLTPWDVASLLVIVLEALGWGLFWSALLRSALSAAVVAIFCTGLSSIYLLVRLDAAMGEHPEALRPLAVWPLGVALIAIAASHVLFTRSGLPRPLRIRFRSPIEVIRVGSRHPSRMKSQRKPSVPGMLSEAVQPGMSRVVGADTLALTPRGPARRSWFFEARALAWQTARHGSKTWCLLAAVGLLPPLLVLLSTGSIDPAYLVCAGIGIALVAGISVFSLENRAGTQRFLNYHAARPGLVWLVKLTVWCLGLAAIWGPPAVLVGLLALPMPRRGAEILVGVLVLPLTFSIAQLSGMTIRRGITALMVALVLTLALAIPLLAGVFSLMVPLWGLFVLPIAPLVVSWAWSGDWLRSRPAPERWMRLGLLLLGAASVVTAGYAGYRVLSVPDVSLIAAPESWIRAASALPPAERNAAELYREAGRRLNSQHVSQPAEYLKRNSEALDLIRRAVARSECQFEALDRLTSSDEPDPFAMDQLVELVLLDAGELQKSGNLEGAWDDMLVLFHMARQLSEGTATKKSLTAWEIEREGLGLAMEWAVAPKQTPERLHKASEAYQALPKMVQAADVIRAEAHFAEKTLNLPADKLRDELLLIGGGSDSWWPAWVDVITMPWEIARARRVNRVLAAAFLQTAVQNPFQRLISSSNGFSSPALDYDRQSTPLADRLIPNLAPSLESSNRNEVGRRALLQVLALRAWQLQHGGQLPDRLEVLVPEELPSLPDDPYTGRPFGYVRSPGEILPSLRYTLRSWLSAAPRRFVGFDLTVQAEASWKPTPGYGLLYSVGPDLHDDHGRAGGSRGAYRQLRGIYGPTVAWDRDIRYDLVFPIPPLPEDPGKRSEPQGQRAAKDQSSGTNRP